MRKINITSDYLRQNSTIIVAFFLLLQFPIFAQIGVGTSTPNSSSLLDVYATNKGILTPRLSTSQRSAISNPAIGLLIYNLDLRCFETYNGNNWVNICNINPNLNAPSIIEVVATDSGASISFDTNTTATDVIYALYSSAGELLATSATTPIVLTGLPNGLPVGFSLVAVTTNGISAGSTLSEMVQPGPAPSAPVKFAVRPGNSSASLSWQAPLSGGPVVNYVVQQRSPINGIQDWVNVVTLPSNTTTYEVLGLQNGNRNLYLSPEYHFRVKAINGAGESVSIILKTVPVGGATVLVHDNFNEVPNTPIWQQYGMTGVFAAAGDASSHMYGQSSGVWSLVPGNGGSTAQTIQTFNRTNKTVDIQFDWYPYPVGGGDSNGALHTFGIFDVNTNNSLTFSHYAYNDNNNIVSSKLNGITSYGVQFRQVENQILHVRIVVFKDGMVKVFCNGGMRQFWISNELINMFTNIKFFAYSTNTGQPQYIDNFTVSEY